jgi:hypothetical protein
MVSWALRNNLERFSIRMGAAVHTVLYITRYQIQVALPGDLLEERERQQWSEERERLYHQHGSSAPCNGDTCVIDSDAKI